MKNVIFIGAGNSQIIGWANMPSPKPVYANAARIFCYTQPWDVGLGWPVNRANPGAGVWLPAIDPLHSQPVTGVGPLMAMADEYITLAGDPELQVGLVPCGWSGETLNWNTTSYAQSGSSYHNAQAFGTLAARIEAARAWGDIKALVMCEGEAEAGLPIDQYTPAIWPNWQEGFFRFVRDVRYVADDRRVAVLLTRLGAQPSGPTYFAAAYPNWANMQGAMDYINGCDPSVKVVTPPDNSTVDGVHRTALANITLGRKLGEALFGIGA